MDWILFAAVTFIAIYFGIKEKMGIKLTIIVLLMGYSIVIGSKILRYLLDLI
jgi:hypothetical protein